MKVAVSTLGAWNGMVKKSVNVTRKLAAWFGSLWPSSESDDARKELPQGFRETAPSGRVSVLTARPALLELLGPPAPRTSPAPPSFPRNDGTIEPLQSPGAAFRNPFHSGLPELLIARSAKSGGQLVHLYSLDGSHWATQVLSTSPAQLSNLVVTSYRGSVQAYWTDVPGRMWRSLLTPAGFSPPVELRWAMGTAVLQCTYYLRPGGRTPEPVLYGLHPGHDSTGTGMWVRTMRGRPDKYTLPDRYNLTSRGHATGLRLSMTGHRSWVLDTTHNGYLRRWDGTAGHAVSGGLTYAMTQISASRVIGTCSPAHLNCPTPLFLSSDGLLYLWHPQRGPIPCTTVSQGLTDAAAVERSNGQCLVFLTNADGRLSVTRQLSVQPLDPRWGYSEVIARNIPVASGQLAAATHPTEPPALFTIGANEISLFAPELALPLTNARTRWIRNVVRTDTLMESGLIAPDAA
ncbi:hypothetical protein [Streptomyces sp. NPDC051577]|uniref:hypothetical protein n=1 Tax=Streptomyces sp. NPDC051577 TaxID=3155166 RepID=UPI003431C99D